MTSDGPGVPARVPDTLFGGTSLSSSPRWLRFLAVLFSFALIATACGDDDDSGDDSPDTTVEDGDDTGDDSGDTGGDDESAYDWSDVRRRQAVSMAIDREAITSTIFLGARQPADDWWPSTFAGYRGGSTCANLQYNPEAAAELWEEAGGTVGPITFWLNSGSGHEEWIEAVSNQLKQNLGVEDVEFQALEFADYLDKLDAAEVDGPFRLGWLMDYPSPGNFLGPLHQTAGSSNHTGYSNPDFDALVEAGDSKPLADAIEDYQGAADILCEDIPFAPMFFGLLQAVNSSNVADVSFDAFQRLNVTDVTDVDGDGEVSVYICEPQNGLFGQMSNETCGSEAVNGLFSGLYSLDKDSGELVFDKVAESIETTDDGTNFTVTLKDGWTFHDGTPVTAQSFVDAWNWLALGANGAQNQYFISILGIQGYDDMNPPDEDEDGEPDFEAATELTGLTAADDLTIEIALDAAFPQLPLVLLYDAFNPLPEVFFDDPEAFGEAPVGNGPFMMDPAVNGGAWEHDVQIATVAYPDYAGTAPSISSLVYKIYSDDTVGYNDVRSGALDVIDQVPNAELGNFKDEFSDAFIEEQTSSFNYLGFPIDLELAASWHAG